MRITVKAEEKGKFKEIWADGPADEVLSEETMRKALAELQFWYENRE